LSAAIYLSRAGLNPLVFAGSPPGGQLMLTTEVENFPGYKTIMGPDLIENLRAQAREFGTTIYDQNVINLELTHPPFKIETSEKTYKSRSVIIATGAQALWLGLESETRLRGKGVSACATCDGFFFKEKIVAVVGGGDTALEEAQTLTKFAKKIYIIHRRSEFRASKIMQDRVMNNPKIELVMNNAVDEIRGENRVESILLKEKYKGSAELAVDGVFIAIGHKPDTALFAESIKLDQKGYVLTTEQYAMQLLQEMQSTSKDESFMPMYRTATSIKGVFAAGDCVDHTYRQASTAAGMGVAAALDVERWLESI